ncbi:hypothetical protein BOTBODRAFT_57834 [Botryobasidium botryosum FD-172 SS1]|uniref:Uncharacterized protein n=1 Tax=Botryobasidium botryosum (strain FD-172 SS1) TaxID=930990 RepID=A0A067MFZ6_BOTB1|nr:hypothetical protein BOTBODRAFT_57834 [Botryobasidium botryosum FD-172 SS1]
MVTLGIRYIRGAAHLGSTVGKEDNQDVKDCGGLAVESGITCNASEFCAASPRKNEIFLLDFLSESGSSLSRTNIRICAISVAFQHYCSETNSPKKTPEAITYVRVRADDIVADIVATLSGLLLPFTLLTPAFI